MCPISRMFQKCLNGPQWRRHDRLTIPRVLKQPEQTIMIVVLCGDVPWSSTNDTNYHCHPNSNHQLYEVIYVFTSYSLGVCRTPNNQ